jgi:hypothetical protein
MLAGCRESLQQDPFTGMVSELGDLRPHRGVGRTNNMQN